MLIKDNIPYTINAFHISMLDLIYILLKFHCFNRRVAFFMLIYDPEIL